MWGMRCDVCMFVIGKLRDSIEIKKRCKNQGKTRAMATQEPKGSRARIGIGLGLGLEGVRERPVSLPLKPKGSWSPNCVFIFFFFASFFLSFRFLLHDDERWKESKQENLVYGVCACVCMCMYMYMYV